jgi:hypothetical protein
VSRWLGEDLHGSTSQKKAFFIVSVSYPMADFGMVLMVLQHVLPELIVALLSAGVL